MKASPDFALGTALMQGVSMPTAKKPRFDVLTEHSIHGNMDVSTPVPTILRDIANVPLLERTRVQQAAANHPLESYARAFENFGRGTTRFISAGAECVVLGLYEGGVLKISRRELYDDLGRRPFDAPVLEYGILSGHDWEGSPMRIPYFVQPKVRMSATTKDADVFEAHLATLGYDFIDSGAHQIGFLHGRLVLVDLFAVSKTA